MAVIRKRVSETGKTSYNVLIRKKTMEVCKTFPTEEDAKLYAFYKERLIDNMSSFDVPISDRITFNQVMELRINKIPLHDSKARSDHNSCLEKFSKVMDVNTFLCKLNYENWLEYAKQIFIAPVYRGSKAEHNKRDMSILTLRRVLATASSAISHAVSLGIPLENHLIKVIQTYVNPILKKS